MFTSIPSLDSVLQCLLPAFTQPSFQTHVEMLLGWVMCLGKRTEYAVFETIVSDTPVSRKKRHPFDRFYNFFSRSAWTVQELAHEVAAMIVVRLNPRGVLYLVVDDTLLHKRGKLVYGLGWFRDAVASTAKRVATASGNHWVVVGLAIQIPGTEKIYCLPIHAKLHLPDKDQPSEATLAKQMLDDILQWFPDRKLVFIGDGAYSANNLLNEMDERVIYVGVMRSDAEIYTPTPPKQPKSKRGPKPKKGPRLPNPREAMKRADRDRSSNGPWTWQTVEATAYGVTRSLQVISFPAVWPKVLELVPILVVLIRDPEGKFQDKYLFTTDMNADLSWVISNVFSKMVDRGRLQIEQASDGNSVAPTLVPGEYREVVPLGLADAKHRDDMVHHRRSQTARSSFCPEAFGKLGHGMVVAPYASRSPQCYAASDN